MLSWPIMNIGQEMLASCCMKVLVLNFPELSVKDIIHYCDLICEKGIVCTIINI